MSRVLIDLFLEFKSVTLVAFRRVLEQYFDLALSSVFFVPENLEEKRC